MTGEELFVTAIIEQAIEDTAYTGVAKDEKLNTRWMQSTGLLVVHPEFVNYCRILDMDVDTIRNKISRPY